MTKEDQEIITNFTKKAAKLVFEETGMEENVTSIEEKVTSTEEEIGIIKEEIGVIKSDITSIKESIEKLAPQEEVDKVEEEIVALKAKNTLIKNNATNKPKFSDTIIKLKKSIDTKSQDIHQIKFDVSTTGWGSLTTPASLPVSINLKSENLILPGLLDAIPMVVTGDINPIIENSISVTGVTGIGEGGTKPLGTQTLTNRQFTYKEIAFVITVTDIARRNVESLETELRNSMKINVNKFMSTSLYSGDGVGTNIAGLKVLGTEFNPTLVPDFKAQVKNGYATADKITAVDVINLAISQARQSGAIVDRIVVDPQTLGSMQNNKDTNGSFTYPLLNVNELGGLRFNGISIYEDNTLPTGSFAIFNSSEVTHYTENGVVMEWGYNSTDWISNKTSLKVYMLRTLVVNAVDAPKIIWGTIAKAKTDIFA